MIFYYVIPLKGEIFFVLLIIFSIFVIIKNKKKRGVPYMIESKWYFGENIPEIKRIRNAVNDIENDIFDKKSLHLMLYNSSFPVACGSLYFDANNYTIAHICVLPEHQRQYIGDMLIKLLLIIGFGMMAERILCHSSPETVPFFKKYGFLPVKEQNKKITMEVTPASLKMESKCGHDCNKCLNKASCKQ